MPVSIDPVEQLWDEDNDHAVNFFSEDLDFALPEESRTRTWIGKILEQEGKVPDAISYIFTSDAFLHKMNVEYLGHDTLTDVITFPYSESEAIAGDVFISIDRIRENARKFDAGFEEELRRVMAHGALHLCGYLDKTAADKKRMTAKEDEALRLWPEMSD